MKTMWMESVNGLGTSGISAFAGFTDVFEIEAAFGKLVEDCDCNPHRNRPLHAVTSPSPRRFGDDAFAVFRSLLANPKDFIDMPIEHAFAPLAMMPDADWYPWLQERYASLCGVAEDAA